jgi:hypothetical protein
MENLEWKWGDLEKGDKLKFTKEAAEAFPWIKEKIFVVEKVELSEYYKGFKIWTKIGFFPIDASGCYINSRPTKIKVFEIIELKGD